MPAGSGAVGVCAAWIQLERRNRSTGLTVASAGFVKLGREQHWHKRQFGAQSPPEASAGQSSSPGGSPQRAANPVTSNVTRVSRRTRTPRTTAALSHDWSVPAFSA